MIQTDNRPPAEVLKEKFLEKKSHAVQEPKANEIHVPETSGHREEMGRGSQEEEAALHQEDTLPVKKISFSKGNDKFDVDEDAVVEFMADKQPVKMTLKELRSAAAGGVAVENRMRKLAEERKEVKSFLRDFSKMSKNDPLKALEIFTEKVREFDPQIDHMSFLESLAQQLQAIGQMEPAEVKAWELERKNKELEGSLEDAKRSSKIIGLKEALIEETGMHGEHFDIIAEALIENPVIAKDIQSEEDLIQKVGELYHEISLQKLAQDTIASVDPKLSKDEGFIQEIALLIRMNPDFTEQELQEIAQEAVDKVKRGHAAQYLSNKKRTSLSQGDYYAQGLSPKEVLKQKFLERRQSQAEQKKQKLRVS